MIGTALEADWTAGPFGAAAHREVTRARSALVDWETRYLELSAKALARRENWVPTHGEPHFANQFLDASGLRLVDWETIAVAPAERDLRDLPEYTTGRAARRDTPRPGCIVQQAVSEARIRFGSTSRGLTVELSEQRSAGWAPV